MTQSAPPPPNVVGTAPATAQEVNTLVGTHLRSFASIQGTIGQDQDWLATVDLTAEPYYFSTEQQTLIKSAIADLDTALDAVNMTFIDRLIGMG